MVMKSNPGHIHW